MRLRQNVLVLVERIALVDLGDSQVQRRPGLVLVANSSLLALDSWALAEAAEIAPDAAFNRLKVSQLPAGEHLGVNSLQLGAVVPAAAAADIAGDDAIVYWYTGVHSTNDRGFFC